jgi:predicted phage-related endonuclease
VLTKVWNYLDNDLMPAVLEHSSVPYMGASLDGITSDGLLACEIKCPSMTSHNTARCGSVPSNYIPQLDHILEVAELDRIHYFSYAVLMDRTEELIQVIHYRDENRIADMLAKEAEFWDMMQNFEAPPLIDADYVQMGGEEWEKLAEQYRDATEHLKHYENYQSECRQALIALAKDRSSQGSGVRLTRYAKRGAVQYGMIRELRGLDLEPYRKKPSICWRVS